MKLKFHTQSYEPLALKQEEPEESLEELLQQYEEACNDFKKWRTAYEQAQAPWRRPRINEQGQEETYVDYDAWEKADPDNFMRYACGDFNACGFIDTLEDDIDIKISHMNQRERKGKK